MSAPGVGARNRSVPATVPASSERVKAVRSAPRAARRHGMCTPQREPRGVDLGARTRFAPFEQEKTMPTRRKKSSGRRYGESASKSVESAMRRKKHGTLKRGKSGHGGTVTSRKQAIAIGLSEAREKGAKVPRKRTGSTSRRSSSARSSSGRSSSGRSSSGRSGSTRSSSRRSSSRSSSSRSRSSSRSARS
ncbi:MAG TPA: DUF6496 domain-containing protein [Candidatus Binatia bacterium]|nr:DUF6496 domain-containing protein [Candidatus Binatia bacterium]